MLNLGADGVAMGSRLATTIESPLHDNIKKAIRENLPGPGNYYLKTERSTPSFRFGTGKRVEERKNDTPGPGHYRIPNTMCDVASYSRTGGFEASYKFI